MFLPISNHHAYHRSRATSSSHDGNNNIVSPDGSSLTVAGAIQQVGSTPTERSGNRRKAEPWGIPTLRIRDPTGHVLMINPDEPVPYESEYFKGIILIMMRADDSKWETQFAGKQRKFEVQIQVFFIDFCSYDINRYDD